jgi:hypothetical protein
MRGAEVFFGYTGIHFGAGDWADQCGACSKLAITIMLFFSASQVLAEEMLYCADTAIVGFMWDRKGEAKSTEFNPERHTVKVVSDSERLITRMQGGPTGAKADQFKCTQDDNQVRCQAVLPIVWNFFPDGYTRAYLYGGPPASGRNPNIWVAYGTCTKF